MQTLLENQLPIAKISELAQKEGNSKKPIYTIHKWWARRLGSVFRSLLIGATLPYNSSEEEFWERFYGKNDLKDKVVLDPFMGGGTTLVESKKMNAKTIGIDIDPLACFITKKELELNEYDLEEQLNILYENVGEKIQELYVTQVDGIKYSIVNVFWSYEVNCPECMKKVSPEPHYYFSYNKVEQTVYCKHCGEIHTILKEEKNLNCNVCLKTTEINNGNYYRGFCTCPNCNHKFRLMNQNKKSKMLAIEYENNNGERFLKKPDKYDLSLYENSKMQLNNIQISYPLERIPRENRWDNRPISHGYYYYKDLFNHRQLFSLSILYTEIKKIADKNLREWFLIGFSDALASNNMLCNYAYGYRKLTPLFGIHAYTVPVRPVENNVWGATLGRGTFEKNIKKVIKAKNYCVKPYESKYVNSKLVKVFTGEKISSIVTNNSKMFFEGKADSLVVNNSSESLGFINDKYVDLILTDPPYYDNIHYSELADFYYQWIKDDITDTNQNPLTNALFVNKGTEETIFAYREKLRIIFTECYRILKDNGMMVFSYHHNKREAWEAMGFAIKSAGFVITNVFPIRSEGNSAYHSSEMSIKWDSILVLRKHDKTQEYNNDITRMINYWENYFKQEKLDLKDCDKLSFYRSLVIQLDTQELINLQELLDFLDEEYNKK